MNQPSRNFDSLIESDELMSWLLFDFEGSIPPESFSSMSGDPSMVLPSASLENTSLMPVSGEAHHSSLKRSFAELMNSNDQASDSSSDEWVDNSRKNDYLGGSKSNKQGNPSRKRSRESLDDLEMRVKELQAENADLHAHLLTVTQRTTEVQRQRVEMERLMIAKLSAVDDSNQEELAEIVKRYTDIYADYGKCRQREVSFHLQQMEKLIIPTKTTKLCLWALQQDKSFFQKSKSPLFDMLSKELELTPEQTLKFQEKREKTLELLAQLKDCLDLLKTLQGAIEKKHEVYDRICGRAQSAATPKQTVKFLMWITRHADVLSKHISGFSRNYHHTPNAEFVEGETLPSASTL